MSEMNFMFCAGCDRRIYDDEPYRRIRESPYCSRCAGDMEEAPKPMDPPEIDYILIASEFKRILAIADATEPFTVESDAAYKRLGLFCSGVGEEIQMALDGQR